MASPVQFDPAAFDPANAPTDALAVNAAILKRMASWDTWGAPIEEIRKLRREGNGPFPPPVVSGRAEAIEIDGKHGPITLRVIAPSRPKGVYLHLHGGGWTVGTADMHDMALERLVDRTGVACISVDYRLAPEHPYPQGPDDCESAALWLVREAKRRFGTDRLVIGGESAGAHLSAVTLLRLRDRHGLTPFRGANLHAGCYDLALTPSARRFGAEKLILNTRDIEMFVRHFLLHGGDVRSPDISPLHADLKGMPPALFTVGTRDALVDDSLFMAARWASAGNSASLEVYPAGCHVFIGFPGSNTDKCLARIDRFVAEACA
ncbi:Acetyl esterase [bacterium YEK0313]|nr:Acetyl esterase [bacterium YEK0313]